MAWAPPTSGPHHRLGPGGSSNEPLYGLLAEFPGPEELLAGARAVRDAGYSRWDCFSPFPVHGIDPAMGIRRTRLPWFVFAGGVTGLVLGLLLQWWANAYHWPWIVSGKPFFSLPANIPITFETTVLVAAFAAFFGMWAANRLPRPSHPFLRSDRFRKVTTDGFFLGVEADDPRFDRAAIEALLVGAGAIAVEACHHDPDPAARRIPVTAVAAIFLLLLGGAVPFALIARARASRSPRPHYHVIPDMDFQPRLRAQNPTTAFADGRSSRPPVTGTVARDELDADEHFYRGLVYREKQIQRIAPTGEVTLQRVRVAEWADTFPDRVPLTPATLARGRDRYAIYCAPCHGESGYGDGMVQKRSVSVPSPGWVVPSNLHADNVVAQPHGELYNSISNGVRVGMKGYAAELPEADRWAVVLFLRALQRSQGASLSDVPTAERARLEQPAPEDTP